MSQPLFILKSKTHYSDPPQIRIELEPIVDSSLDVFWADPKNPSGRCEFYIAPELDLNYRVGSEYRLQLTFVPSL